MFEVEFKRVDELCEKLIKESNADVATVGSALKMLIKELREYVNSVSISEETTRLIKLETETVAKRNENLVFMLATATKLLEILPDASKNEEIVKFVKKSSDYLRG